jgi:predicted ATPase
MYIKSIEIQNIRAIKSMQISFKQLAGWHVLLGENGSGKSTIIKSISLALIGPEDIGALRQDWRDWLSNDSKKGSIKLKILQSTEDNAGGKAKINTIIDNITPKIEFERNGIVAIKTNIDTESSTEVSPKKYNWSDGKGWFSAGFGPYRRFAGGNADKERIFYSNPKAGAHLSVFGEDIALSEANRFLIDLHIKRLENKEGGQYLEDILLFINNSGLLPHGGKISQVSSEGVFCTDGNAQKLTALQLSDGLRSVLSLTFELIRQLIRVYGEFNVFKEIRKGNQIIDLSGVVLIDEIDVHLHPTWQTRIGQWFIQYFPKIQFIVTTHSPLICRASENGSIWKLSSPGFHQSINEIVGVEKNKLILGNILEAYSTEVFGQNLEKSEIGVEKTKRLAILSNKEAYNGQLNTKESKELEHLKTVFTTNATIEL